jgi:hypothetical protein
LRVGAIPKAPTPRSVSDATEYLAVIVVGRIAAAISRIGSENTVAFGKVGRATAAKGTSVVPPTQSRIAA